MPSPNDQLTRVLAVAALGVAIVGVIAMRRAHSGPGVLARSKSGDWFRLVPIPAGDDEPAATLEVEHA